MIIDKILDRRDAEIYGDFDYNAKEFYLEILSYGRPGDDITAAMDYGTEKDVKNALRNYIIKNEYNRAIIEYIDARLWLKNTDEIQPFININRGYKTEKTTGAGGAPCLLIDNRYLIYLDNGVIYDALAAQDIPQYVFNIRDDYLEE